jgi:hypothetical protein
MYIPKKLKWDTLGSFKKFLETETSEKIVSYNGYEIITETTEYGIIDSQLNCRHAKKKVQKETVNKVTDTERKKALEKRIEARTKAEPKVKTKSKPKAKVAAKKKAKPKQKTKKKS